MQGERERGEEEDLLGIAGKVIGFQVELEVEWERWKFLAVQTEEVQ